jgi:large subunit ribosomal protein L24
MKFKLGDTVLVTAGKDKGKQGKVVKVLLAKEAVVVDEVNMYVKHMKPMNNQPGQRVLRPRPLPTAKVAILNNEGKQDRIGYKVSKDGAKVRIYKKTGKEIPEQGKKK